MLFRSNTLSQTPSNHRFEIDNTGPTASLSYSGTAPYKEATVVTITATFDDEILATTQPKIAVSSVTGGSTLTPKVMTKVYDTVYQYNYTVTSGNGTATVALSDVVDTAGNTLSQTPSNHRFEIDNTRPTASLSYSGTAPYKEATVVTITATFDDEILATTQPKIEIGRAHV